MLIDNYAGLILNDHMDEIRSNTDFENDMEKVRAAVQACGDLNVICVKI